MALTYFAADGSYGNAAGLIVLDTRAWGPDDWEQIDEASDEDRGGIAAGIALSNGDI